MIMSVSTQRIRLFHGSTYVCVYEYLRTPYFIKTDYSFQLNFILWPSPRVRALYKISDSSEVGFLPFRMWNNII